MSHQVVVFGAGQGGLVAAIYARLAGHDVVVLEASGQVGGKAAGIEMAGFQLDPGPSIIILPRIYAQVFKDAGRQMAEYLTFQRLNPISRVIFEGAEAVDLPADRREGERLVDQIAPEDGLAFRNLMRSLEAISPNIDRSIFQRPYDRPWQLADPNLIAVALKLGARETYKEFVDRRFKSPFLRAFFYGFPSYGGQTYDRQAPGALLIPYLMMEEGVFFPVGGVRAIPKAFRRLAEVLGVEFRENSRVVSLEVRGEHVVSAKLADGSSVSGSRFISNVDRSTTRTWFGRSDHRPPSLSYFTVHLGIGRRLSGLSHHTLLVPRDFERGFEKLYRERDFPEPPIVYLNDTTDSDPNAAPAGCTNLFCVLTSPAEEPHLDWVRDKALYRNRVMESVERFGFAVSPDEIVFERIQTPRYFAETHGNYRGSLYGVDERERLFGGMFPNGPEDPEMKNLLYCGGSVQPGAGLPMVTLSGKFAAQRLR